MHLICTHVRQPVPTTARDRPHAADQGQTAQNGLARPIDRDTTQASSISFRRPLSARAQAAAPRSRFHFVCNSAQLID